MHSNVTLFVMSLETVQVTLMAQLHDVLANEIQVCTVRLHCVTASHTQLTMVTQEPSYSFTRQLNDPVTRMVHIRDTQHTMTL